MNTIPAEAAPKAVQRRSGSSVDRLLRVVAVGGLVLLVLSFYLVEAWLRRTPWVFTDELEWSQLSRSIAATGHAARRGQPIFWKSFYSWLIAPAWWIHSTQTAYTVIKFVNAVAMCLASVPAYFLARMLVTRRAAIMVAVLTVAIPGMAYAGSIIPESLAYTWFALTSLLVVRALTTRRLRDVVLASACCVVAVLVKSELELALVAFALAAAGLWVTGPHGSAMRRNWTRGDYIGALTLLVGGLFLFNRVVLNHVYEWHWATEYWKSRMVDLGLSAGAALAVGLGLLPAICGFVALRLPDRRGEPAYRAFAAYLAAAILVFGLYTAGKAAYLSTVFASLTEERNLIYLSPLLLVATALVLEARRIDWRIVAAATAVVLYVVVTKPFELGYPYFEAPGESILTVANRRLRWGDTQLDRGLLIAGAVAVSLVAVRRVRGVAPVAGTLLLAWLLVGEIGASAGADGLANGLQAALPRPIDGIDRITHGKHVTVLGQTLNVDPNGLWLAEFWNRSVSHVAALDGTAPGPGPGFGPSLVSTDGLLSQYNGDPYVLASPGITLQAPIVGHYGPFTLYRLHGPWKLYDSVANLYTDGWAPAHSGYTYYVRGGPGKLVVEVARTAYNGSAPPGHVKITVGTVKLDSENLPEVGRVLATRRLLIQNGAERSVTIPVKQTPVTVAVDVHPTFKPSASDQRDLGAQLSFKFVRANSG